MFPYYSTMYSTAVEGRQRKGISKYEKQGDFSENGVDDLVCRTKGMGERDLTRMSMNQSI